VRVERRCIAAARNGGARHARGEMLAFVDADMRIHPGTFGAIDAALARGDVVGGATGVTLERWSVGLAVTFVTMLPMVWLTGMDTGVVFCRRADFAALGGYDERRRIAEDVAFLLALRRRGRARRARLTRLRSVKAVVSTRKFDAYGDWHYFTTMLGLPLMMLLRRRAAHRLIERYWYAPDR
jgi:glycosyltransferase involved in cell wall biosynthesis